MQQKTSKLLIFLIIVFSSNCFAGKRISGHFEKNGRGPASTSYTDIVSKKLSIHAIGNTYGDEVMIGERSSYHLFCSGLSGRNGELWVYTNVKLKTFKDFMNQENLNIDLSNGKSISKIKFDTSEDCGSAKNLLESASSQNPTKIIVTSGSQFTIEN